MQSHLDGLRQVFFALHPLGVHAETSGHGGMVGELQTRPHHFAMRLLLVANLDGPTAIVGHHNQDRCLMANRGVNFHGVKAKCAVACGNHHGFVGMHQACRHTKGRTHAYAAQGPRVEVGRCGQAQFLRLADNAAELRDNRRGAVELLADVTQSLLAIIEAGKDRQAATDKAWASGLRDQHLARADKLQQSMRQAPAGSDGLMHPNRLLSALRDALPANSVVVADGGDFLSFTRVGLPATTYLDPGSLGCIGVGTPFGVAASLVHPDKTVVVATGDGAFGFNAMEIDTAVRHQAPVLVVVANNGSWAIEVRDQQETHGKVVGTRLQFSDYAGMAKSFGMHAQRVEREEDLAQAIQMALQNRPALLDVLVTPEAASSDAKSGLAWVPDLQALAAWDDAERQWREKQSAEQ